MDLELKCFFPVTFFNCSMNPHKKMPPENLFQSFGYLKSYIIERKTRRKKHYGHFHTEADTDIYALSSSSYIFPEAVKMKKYISPYFFFFFFF